MSGDNWKTLRVPPEAYEDAKAQKEAADRTWGEQIVRPDDEADATDEGITVEQIREELDTDAPNFDDVREAVATIEERTGRIEATLEDLEGRTR